VPGPAKFRVGAFPGGGAPGTGSKPAGKGLTGDAGCNDVMVVRSAPPGGGVASATGDGAAKEPRRVLVGVTDARAPTNAGARSELASASAVGRRSGFFSRHALTSPQSGSGTPLMRAGAVSRW
jgi:hypothetical protein